MNIINIKNVTKIIRKREGWFKSIPVEILKNISLSINDGEFVVMLGRNGSGKSTLLKCIAGILYVEKGEIIVDKKPSFKNRRELTQTMGVLFGQKSLIFTDLKAIDYLLLLKKIYGLSDEDFQSMITMVDHILPCKNLLDKQVRGMSYGERMKIELLSVIIHSPQILILDEPFVGLDPASQQQLLNFIKFYKEKMKATVILTTHQFLEILNIADRAIVIDSGSVTYDGNVDVLLKPYQETKLIQVTWVKELENIQLNRTGIKMINKTANKTLFEVLLSECSIEDALKDLIEIGMIADVEVKSIPIDKVVEVIYEKN